MPKSSLRRIVGNNSPGTHAADVSPETTALLSKSKIPASAVLDERGGTEQLVDAIRHAESAPSRRPLLTAGVSDATLSMLWTKKYAHLDVSERADSAGGKEHSRLKRSPISRPTNTCSRSPAKNSLRPARRRDWPACLLQISGLLPCRLVAA
jgi:hypothetical protein